MAGFGKNTPTKRNTSKTKKGARLLEEAIKAHKKGDTKAAEGFYIEAIESGFHHEIAFSNLGVIYKNTNREREAAELYRLAILIKPGFVDAHTNLGNLLRELGEYEQALTTTLKSIELSPDNPTAYINLTGIYKDLDQIDEALACALKYLELKPDNPKGLMNLGSIYKDLGQLNEAEAYTLKSLELKQDNPKAHMNLGSIYKDQGKLDDALAYTLKSIELEPDNHSGLMNLGVIYKELGRLDKAIATTLKSIEHEPNNANAHTNLGSIYLDLDKTEETRKSFLKAAEIDPSSLEKKIQANQIIDRFYLDDKDIDICRKEYEEGIDEIAKNTSLLYKDKEICLGIFSLAYHNREDDKRLLEKTTSALTNNASLNTCLSKFNKSHKRNSSSEKIRVGIVSDYLGNHAVGYHFDELVKYLAKSGMEIFIFNGPKARKDHRMAKLDRNVNQYDMPASIRISREMINDKNLDIILFTEIGMSAHTYTIALAKLAPVQVAMTGHPNTTGLNTIDYFVSSALTEDEDSDKFYTEILIKFNHLTSTMKMPRLSEAKTTRSMYGLEEKALLVGFPHSLIKLHPEFDKILDKLAKEIPNINIIFFNTPNRSLAKKIRERWKKKNLHLYLNEKVIYIDTVPFTKFMNYLEMMDFILDPFYFGSGTVFSHAMAVGTPIVTLPQKQMRSRVVAGGYKQMAINKPPIAKSIADYINLCKELADNKLMRNELRVELKLKAGIHLFDNKDTLVEWDSFIKAAIESNKKGELLSSEWNSGIY